MSETTETKPQPTVELQLEKLTFGRSDGKTTVVSLIDDVFEKEDAVGAIAWVILMKLQEVTELQQVGLQQMQKLLELAGRQPEMPDTQEAVRAALGAVGLKPEDLVAAMKQAHGSNGVSVTRTDGEG